MDPDTISQMLKMFAPKMGMDPFALGSTMATNPNAAASLLGKNMPPPPPGTNLTDYFKSKVQQGSGPLMGAMPTPSGQPTSAMTGGVPGMPRGGWTQPATANPAVPQTRSATPFPPPGPSPEQYQPPVPSPLASASGALDLTTAGYNPASTLPNAPEPTPDPNMPSPQPDAPYLNLPGLPKGGQGMTADANIEPQAAPPPGTQPEGPNTRRTVPDIQAPLTGSTAPAGAAAKPALDPKKLQEALKSLGGALAGVKAPPPPETQKISTPGLPHPGAMPGGTVQGLIAALGGLQPGAQQVPLRLGNALYAGGRGIY